MVGRTNWLNTPNEDHWSSHLLEDLIGGYKAGGEPRRMRQEEERQRLLAEQLRLGNENQRTANELQRPMLEQKQQMGDIDLQTGQLNLNALPQKLRDELEERALKNKTAEKNLKWIDPQQEALREQRLAAAKKSLRGPQPKPSNAAQELMDLGLQPGSDEFNEALRRKIGQPSGRKIPAGTRDLLDMPVNERLDAVKRMRNVVNSYGKVKQVQNNVAEMKTIISENPEIAGSLATVFLNPDDPGIKSILASWATSEKKKTAIQKFVKLASDINLNELSSFGNQITDARQELQAKTKASPNMTPAAINFVLDKIEKQKEPYERFYKATKKGLEHDYEVYDDPEAFRLENMSDEQLAELKEELKKKQKK